MSLPLPRVAAFAALLLAGAWTLPAAAQTSIGAVEIVPSAPTWQDEVEILISGTSPCQVSVADTRVSAGTVTVELASSCSVAPDRPRFAVAAEVGRLKPMPYGLVVENGAATLEAQFTVFDRAPIAIEPAAGPYVDEQPVRFDLLLFDNGVDLSVVPRPGLGIIEVFLDRDSDFALIPPDPSAITVQADAGLLPAGDYEIQVIDVTNPSGSFEAVTRDITVHDADGCVPSATELCLGDGRFRVEVAWRDFRDRRGDGVAVPLEGRDDTGSFWFFNENNLELTVKVLDGCGVNGHHWVFVSSGSTVEYEITVTDTAAEEGPGRVRTYRNALRQTPDLIPDTGAFPDCD